MRRIAFVVPLVLALAPAATVQTSGQAGAAASADSGQAAREAHPTLGDMQLPGGDVIGTCTGCHEVPREISHPVGVKPPMTPPADFPLDDRGLMTCLTCHDVPQGAAGLATSPRFFLRREWTNGAICEACHGQAGRTTQHAAPGQLAHGAGAWVESGEDADVIDGQSTTCMVCHDGSIAGDVGSGIHRLGGASAAIGPAIGTTHPIGVDYHESARQGTALESPGPRATTIRLYGGKIGCGSCHSPFSKQPKLLVTSNDNSALCLDCHKT